MTRTCGSCGRDYEAKRKNSRFCGDTCRKRGQRGHLRTVEPPASTPAGDLLVEATRTELTKVGRAETARGQAALLLARRIEAGQDTGAGLASLTREWRATLDEAVANAAQAGDAVDRLRLVVGERLGGD